MSSDEAPMNITEDCLKCIYLGRCGVKFTEEYKRIVRNIKK